MKRVVALQVFGHISLGQKIISSASFLIVLLLLAFPNLAAANTVFATQDTYLKQGSKNKNQGSEAILRIRQSGKNRALVQFDQSEITAIIGAGNLTSARLRLYIDTNANNWGSLGRSVTVHRMTQAWTELGATWNCPDDSNTANSSADCTQWDMTDSSQWPFFAVPTDVVVYQNNQTGWVEFTVTDDVQAFLSGIATNFGWLIKKADEGQSGKVDYSSREGSFSPELFLEIDGPVPPPVPKIADTYIKQGGKNQNHGFEVILRVRKSAKNRALVAVDQADIEQAVGNATLISAKLKLNILFSANNWGPSGREVAVHRMIQGWTEVGATWNCADDLNTENNKSDCPTTAWDMKNNAPFLATETDKIFHFNNQLGEVEWDVTADVQAFLDGSAINYGWLIKRVDGNGSGHVEYSSHEGPNPPELIVEVSGDTDPPIITVNTPADNSFINTTPVTVTGSVNEPASLTINETAVSLDGSNNFTHNVTLTEGVNPITVVATDSANNTTTVALTVNLDTVPPGLPVIGLISISDPVNGIVTVTGQDGSVEPNATVTITNTRGQSVTETADANGAFTAQLAGQAGDTYQIVASDQAQNNSAPVTVDTTPPEPEPAFILYPNPSSGVAPLTVVFSLLGEAVPATLTLDLEGDGVGDFTGPSLDEPIFSYAAAGRFLPTVTITDAQGNEFTASVEILVEDQAALDALLQSQWAGMKAALQQGDIQGALQFMAPQSRPAYEAIFTELVPILSTVGTDLGDIQFVEVRQNLAEYELLAFEDGQTMSYYIEFIRDQEEQWHLKFF